MPLDLLDISSYKKAIITKLKKGSFFNRNEQHTDLQGVEDNKISHDIVCFKKNEYTYLMVIENLDLGKGKYGVVRNVLAKVKLDAEDNLLKFKNYHSSKMVAKFFKSSFEAAKEYESLEHITHLKRKVIIHELSIPDTSMFLSSLNLDFLSGPISMPDFTLKSCIIRKGIPGNALQECYSVLETLDYGLFLKILELMCKAYRAQILAPNRTHNDIHNGNIVIDIAEKVQVNFIDFSLKKSVNVTDFSSLLSCMMQLIMKKQETCKQSFLKKIYTYITALEKEEQEEAFTNVEQDTELQKLEKELEFYQAEKGAPYTVSLHHIIKKVKLSSQQLLTLYAALMETLHTNNVDASLSENDISFSQDFNKCYVTNTSSHSSDSTLKNVLLMNLVNSLVTDEEAEAVQQQLIVDIENANSTSGLQL